MAFVFALLVSGTAHGVEWAEWNFSSDFDGNDEIFAESSSDSDSLMRLSAGTSAFSISGGILTCTQTGPSDYLRIDIDDLQANGGGSYVNEYTLILDIRIDDPDWLPLYNTGYDNYNAAELWVRSDGSVGLGTYTGPDVIPQSVWTRLVVTRYLDGGTWYRKIYADGILEASGRDGEGTDGNLSLYTNAHQDAGQFTILSDYDVTVYGACKLGNFGFVSEAMSDSEIAVLGGYDANGIGLGEESNTGLVGHWRYEQAHISGSVVEDLTGDGNDGTIVGTFSLNPSPEALILDGSNNYVTVTDGPLPVRDITLEAWVQVASPVGYAGIISYIQDNGSTEHGWILGQYSGAFLFGLSTGSLTYLSASETFDTGTWYHVVGTYDGSEMNIYVNGEPAGSSSAQSGDISYLSSWFRMGSYKDDNEEYLWEGMIAEVAIYNTALEAGEVQAKFDARKEEFGFADFVEVKAGPYVHFTKKAEVTVYWKTETAVASVLQYGVEPNLDQTVEDLTPKTEHELTVTGLKPETNYNYLIDVNGIPTHTYEFYSAFDFGPEPFPGGASPYPTDSLTSLYEQAAEYIINTSGINKGVCIDYGCGRGRLAYEIAKRSNLKIIGFEEDANKVAEARNYLDEAGIYGVQVTVLTGSLSGLNCRDYSANLVVSDRIIAEGVCPGSSAEMFRVLAPDGGAAYVGQPPSCPNSLSEPALASWLGGLSYSITNDSNGLWAEVTRGAVAGAGEWTHFYADLANTANSGETNLQNSMKVLWYGQPGPRYITDRHNRPMPSLYKDGLIVTPGIHRLMAFDAYNGTRYWDVAIPEVTRVAVLKDCGWVALASDYAYVAHKQNCVGLDLGTGEPTIHLQAPQLISGEKRNWGYLALEDSRVYGSGQKDGASVIGHSLGSIMSYAYADNRPIATSDYLFCLDRHTGSTSWTYKRTGSSVIINPAIVMAGDYICFIESRNTDAINDSDGRVQASVLMSGSSEYLVKLNKTTGAEVTVEPIDLPFEHVVYLSYAASEDLLIATGSRNDPGCRYEQYAYNLSDFGLAWNSDYYQGTTNGDHGEQDQHPVIVGSTMYSRYYKVNLSNGSVTAFPLSRGNCGTQSACATHLLGRNGNPYIYELPVGTPIQMTNETRPGCWINMIPAGGLLLIPESSAGCTCDYPIQTSMVFMPD